MLYSGVTGKLGFKAEGDAEEKDIMHMATWNVELSKDIVEVVSFGDDYKEKVPSIKDWTASADGTADFSTEAGQAMLLEAFESGDPLIGTFYLDETTFLRGTCFVESCSVSHAADGKADVSISLAGSGAVTLTTP